MPLFKPRDPASGLPALRVATPDGKCPLCRVGEPDGKVMIGPIEVAACKTCTGYLLGGLNMAKGLSKLAGWLKARSE